MIESNTRSEIKGFLEGFLEGLALQHRNHGQRLFDLARAPSPSAKGQIKPFHEALLPDGVRRVSAFERSFSTKLGTTFEECARLIGKQHYMTCVRGYKVEGTVSQEAVGLIESSVSSIGRNGLVGNYHDLVRAVIKAEGRHELRRVHIVDLYLRDREDNEIFFEIKSPQPNKGQCLEVAERLLAVHAIRGEGPPRVRTYYAMAYNPNGQEKKEYNWSFAKRYMDVDNQVLVGKEFWDLLGGRDTYEELVGIYQEVGREKGPDVFDRLALDY